MMVNLKINNNLYKFRIDKKLRKIICIRNNNNKIKFKDN